VFVENAPSVVPGSIAENRNGIDAFPINKEECAVLDNFRLSGWVWGLAVAFACHHLGTGAHATARAAGIQNRFADCD
jgi:hypothetical protein